MLSAEDFTPNDVVDNFQIGDNTVDIIGYVIYANNNLSSPTKAKFKKLVISNGSGREVQIISWNENTKIIDPVKELGRIVHVGSLKCSAVKSKQYNNSNVDFELIIKENSTVEVYDTYKGVQECLNLEDISLIDAYDKVGHKVKIDAIIKSEPAKYKNRDYEMIVASITDCSYMLEMKLNFDCSGLKLMKGVSVEIIVTVEQHRPGPALLRVDCKECITILDREKVSFAEILNGFRTKPIKAEDKE